MERFINSFPIACQISNHGNQNNYYDSQYRHTGHQRLLAAGPSGTAAVLLLDDPKTQTIWIHRLMKIGKDYFIDYALR